MRLLSVPRISSVCALAALATIAVAPSVSAWESDVHASLTCWLARKAGFNEHDAARVAKANQDLDDSRHHAAIMMMIGLLISGDVGIARDLQAKHFPSAVDLPNPPQLRVVVPNSPAAKAQVDAVTSSKRGTNELIRLGEALHPFQDSWSHQGIPDSPWGWRSDLGVGHPRQRGGWRSHDADLTHLHVDEALEMARATFDAFERFLTNNPGVRESAAKRWSWKELEPEVRAFVSAMSAETKNAWIERQAITLAASGLTIAGSAPRAKQVRILSERRAVGRAMRPAPMVVSLKEPLSPAFGGTVSGQALPPDELAERRELVRIVQDFLRRWFVEQDVRAAAVRETRWRGALSEEDLRLNGLPAGLGSERLLEWWQKMLTMYLVDDHAQVNNLGHCEIRHSGYARLPVAPERQGELSASKEITVPVLDPGDFVRFKYEPAPNGPLGYTGGAYALPIQLSSQPHDALVLVWRKTRNDSWKLTAMVAMVG